MDLWGRVRSGSERISDLDRQRVLDVIAECREEGYLDAAEQELAVAHVESAVDRKALDEVLSNLPRRARDGSHQGRRRATEPEKEDAERRLEMYASRGAIEPDELKRRIARVEMARTPDEISEVFTDLGALDADKTSRRVSTQQRDRAISQLNAHLAAERLTVDEHRRAVDQVRNARSWTEIDVAFRGLTSPRIQTAHDGAAVAVKRAGALAAEGGRRVRRALTCLVLTAAAVIIGIVLVATGSAIPGVVCLALAAGLFVVAMRALFVGRSAP